MRENRVRFGSGVDHGFLRDGELMTAGGLENHGHIGFWLELQPRVAELNPHLGAARLGIDLGIDERHFPVERAGGLAVRELDLRVLSDLQALQLVLEDLPEHPDRRQVGDLERAHLGADVLPGKRIPFEDNAAERRIQGQRLAWLSGPFEFGNLIVTDVPQLQAVTRRADQ